MENPNLAATYTIDTYIIGLIIYIFTKFRQSFPPVFSYLPTRATLEKPPETPRFPGERPNRPSLRGAKAAQKRELYKIFNFPQERPAPPTCGKTARLLVVQRKRTGFPQPFGNRCGKTAGWVSHRDFSGECGGIVSVFVTVPQPFHSFPTSLSGNSTGCGKLVWKTRGRLERGVGTPWKTPAGLRRLCTYVNWDQPNHCQLTP